MIDRIPLILALLDDLVRSNVDRSDHPLAALSDGLTLCVDHGAVANAWWEIDKNHRDSVAALASVVSGGAPYTMDSDPVVSIVAEHIAVARRLADVAASLRVRGDAFARESEALWDAASRLLGMTSADQSTNVTMRDELKAWRAWGANNIAALSITDSDEAMRAALDDVLATWRRNAGMTAADRKVATDNRHALTAWRSWAIETAAAPYNKDTDDNTLRDLVGARIFDLITNLANILEINTPLLDDPGAVVDIVSAVKKEIELKDEWRDAYAVLDADIAEVLKIMGLRSFVRKGDNCTVYGKWKEALLDKVTGKDPCDTCRRERADATNRADTMATEIERLKRDNEALRDSTTKMFQDSIRLADALTTLKRKHAEDDRALVEAHARELREAKEAHAADLAQIDEMLTRAGWTKDKLHGRWLAPPPSMVSPQAHDYGPGVVFPKRRPTADEIKAITLQHGASECTVCHGPKDGELTLVVCMQSGRYLQEVVDALLAAGLHPADYTIREVKSPMVARGLGEKSSAPTSYCDEIIANVADKCTATITNEIVNGRKVVVFDVIPKHGKTLSDVYSFVMDIVPLTERLAFRVRDASMTIRPSARPSS